MGWRIAGIVLAVLIALIVFAPVRVIIQYDARGLSVWMPFGPFRKVLYPAEKKPEKKKSKKKKQSSAAKKPQQEKKSGNLQEFYPYLHILLDFLKDLRRKIRIRFLQMHLTMAGDDPCDLAVNYGKAWGILANIVPLLERVFVIRKKDLQVNCDFQAEQTKLYVYADVSITFGRLFFLLCRYGKQVIHQYKNRRGAENE